MLIRKRNQNRFPAIIRIVLFIISWVSLFFLPKESIRKYLSAGTFSSLLVLIVSMLSIPLKLWKVQGGMREKIFNDFSFIFGPYFTGTIWIFHLTFGRFWLYTLTNAIMDAFLSFPLISLFQKLNVYKLERYKPIQVFYTTTGFAFALYMYQLFISKPKSDD